MRKLTLFSTGLLAATGSSLAAPQVLAFPYHRSIGATSVYSETVIDVPAMTKALARAEALRAASNLGLPPSGKRIFLTNGGWRWHLLALQNSGSYALTRPISDFVSDAVIVNRRAFAEDALWSEGQTDGQRTLSGTIAHEQAHIAVRRTVGLVRSLTAPEWLNEGVADFVAQESRLTAAQVEHLKSKGQSHRAIVYFEGRRRVAAALAANGHSLTKLYEGR